MVHARFPLVLQRRGPDQLMRGAYVLLLEIKVGRRVIACMTEIRDYAPRVFRRVWHHLEQSVVPSPGKPLARLSATSSHG
jgi:hypothetical protein